VTGLDWGIVAFAGILALLGFRQGFIVGVLSLAGFALGAFVGTRVGPLLLPRGSSSPYAPAFGLLGALLAGAILANGFEGVGFRLRRLLVLPGLGIFDGILGALLGVVLGLGIVWIAAAVAAQSSAHTPLRADIQRSAILRRLNELLPPSGPVLGALARLDPLPSITGPSANVAPPQARIAHEPGVRRAAASVVKVEGTACGLAIEGSGWVAAAGVVVTNAHVVAGETDTTVQVGGQPPVLPARVLAFDATDDIAVLAVDDLRAPALTLAANPPSGASGAILGFPGNGPFDVEPARTGRTQSALTQNAYGEGPVSRVLTPLRGLVRPGNSGGPVVAADGDVLTTVFAATVDRRPRGGYGVANDTVAVVLRGAEQRLREGRIVATGRCAPG
jgi:S1-C subfamily serine protease